MDRNTNAAPSVALHREHAPVRRAQGDAPWHWVLTAVVLTLALFALGAWLDEFDATREAALGRHDAALAAAYHEGRKQGRRDGADAAMDACLAAGR